MKEQKTIIDISIWGILKIVATIAVIFLIIQVWQIFASVFLAAIISFALEPSLAWLEKKNVKRIISVPIIYLTAFGAIAGIFSLVLPGLLEEIRILSLDLPDKIDTFVSENLSDTFLGGLVPNLQEFFSNIQDRVGDLGGNFFGFATTIFGGIISFLFVVIASFWFCLDRREVHRFLVAFTPAAHRNYITGLASRIQKRLGHWVQTQFILAVIMGFAVFILLTILGSKFALTLGVVAGFLEVIPFIGPLITGALMLGLVSLDSSDTMVLGLFALDSFVKGLVAVVVYVIFQQIEQNFVVPTIMSKVVGSNPIVILVAALVGVELLGFWGVVLAIPTVAVISEIMQDIKKQRPNV